MSKVWERTFSAIYDPLLWGRRGGPGMAAAKGPHCSGRREDRCSSSAPGTGLNLPHYPDGLDELVLTEPSAADGRPARAASEEIRDPLPR